MINRIQRQRLVKLSGGLLLLFVVIGLVLYALRSNINLFYTPTQVIAGQVPANQIIRIGGLVVPHSFKREGTDVSFDVGDTMHTIRVFYQGILPDLFRDGQGVVVTGELKDGRFYAKQVLARHDENYMPPDVSKAIGEQFKPMVRDGS